jgi:hypothetical protein
MVVWIGVVGMMFIQSSVVSAEREIAEFSFNRPVAVTHARAAIEDFGELMMKQQPLSSFDFTRPQVTAVVGQDCNDRKINVVLVAFPDKKKEGWAYSYWERNKDGLISRLLSVGFSSETLEFLIRQGRAGGTMCN